MAVAGCAAPAAESAPGPAPAPAIEPEPGSEPGSEPTATHPREETYETIEVPGRTLVFEPSRPDFTVETAVFNVYCSEPGEARIDGEPAKSQWTSIELARVGENRFELRPLRIEQPVEGDGLLCLSVKVWFREVDNMFDSLYYAHVDDRYALASYCTRAAGPGWEGARPRFRQNRLESLPEFLEALSHPLRIRLNDRSLDDLKALVPQARGAESARTPGRP